MTALVITGITTVVGALGTLLVLIWRTYQDVKVIKSQGEHRQKENKIQFRAIFALIKCVRTGVVNGELHAVEQELHAYMQNEAIR